MMNESSSCSTSLPTFGVLSVPDFVHSNRWQCCLVVVIYVSPITWCGASPPVLVICPSFWGEMSFQIVPPLLNGLFVFLLLGLEVFVYSGNHTLSDMCFAKILFPSLWLVFFFFPEQFSQST